VSIRTLHNRTGLTAGTTKSLAWLSYILINVKSLVVSIILLEREIYVCYSIK